MPAKTDVTIFFHSRRSFTRSFKILIWFVDLVVAFLVWITLVFKATPRNFWAGLLTNSTWKSRLLIGSIQLVALALETNRQLRLIVRVSCLCTICRVVERVVVVGSTTNLRTFSSIASTTPLSLQFAASVNNFSNCFCLVFNPVFPNCFIQSIIKIFLSERSWVTTFLLGSLC